jgi:hypothetical protein
MIRLLSLLLLAGLIAPTVSAEVPSYTVYRARAPITIDGFLEELDWQSAPSVGAFQFPWTVSGEKEQTEVKMLWDDKYLYVSYTCDDKHIWAEHYTTNTDTYKDDCVEMFWSPHNETAEWYPYFMFEMNCIGNLLSVFNSGDKSIFQNEIMPPHMAQSIRGTVNNDADADTTWVLEIAIRFDDYPELTTRTPKAGDIWRVGLNRCGGKTNPQSSQWSPSQTPKSNFHRPQDFGRIIFSDLPVRKRR